MLCFQPFLLFLAWFSAARAGNLRGMGVPQAPCMTSIDVGNNLYGLQGQPESSTANSEQKQCQPQTCSNAHSIEPGLFGVNDGPLPYDLGLPSGYPKQINSSEMGHVYKDTVGFTGVRNDESGLAFDIRCMFPVANLSEIPYLDVDDDTNWNWNETDRFFSAVVDAGLAPLLKIPVFEWNSPRITGLSYVDRDGKPQYLIKPHSFANCSWPAIAPVITQIGHKLVKRIVDRYNKNGYLNKSHWKQGFAGVEIFNEWNGLRCGPRATPLPVANMCEVPSHKTAFEHEHAIFTQECFGTPWTWNNHYWDGTPQQAWDFYVKAYKLVKGDHPNVRVGGPAISTGTGHFPCGKYDGLGKWWIESFLDTALKGNASVDFLSFHQYNNRLGNLEYFYKGFKSSLDKYSLSEVPILLTEYNAQFQASKNAGFVGSLAGAAVNLGKLFEMSRWPNMKAAYVLDGRVGAYTPGNLYTFPLLCHANATCANNASLDAVCDPEEVRIPGGVWGDCNATDMQTLDHVDPENDCAEGKNTKCRLTGDMATVFADGRLSPFGAALSVLKHAKNSRILPLSPSTLSRLEGVNVGAFAWQPTTDSRFASLLLTNMGNQSTGLLPGASVLLSQPSASKVVGASQIVQRQLARYGTASASNDIDGDVGGLKGIETKGLLEGFVREAIQFCGNGVHELPALEPYQTVLLAVEYSDGCLCQDVGSDY